LKVAEGCLLVLIDHFFISKSCKALLKNTLWIRKMYKGVKLRKRDK
jgi:hypothetical protein